MPRLLACLLMACAVLSGPVSTAPSVAVASVLCEPSELLVNPCRPWLGATASSYPGVSSSPRAQLEAHEQRIGRQLDIVHTYHPPGSLPLNADELYFIHRPNTIAFVNWKPAAVWADAAGGNAAVNAQIDQAADNIEAIAPQKILLTVFHEPENDVSAGNCAGNASGAGAGSPTDYRNMWRNVHDRFAARGVDNVVWVMNYMGYSGWDCLVGELWPGNDLVDWVMFDPYGDAASTDFVANVGRFYDLLTRASDPTHDYLSKPWGLAEWGFFNATSELGVSYFDQARQALEAHTFPLLRAYIVYDAVDSAGNENRVAYTAGGVFDQARLDAYVAFANHPRFTVP